MTITGGWEAPSEEIPPPQAGPLAVEDQFCLVTPALRFSPWRRAPARLPLRARGGW